MLVILDEEGCKFGEKCVFAHRRVEEQPSKRSKKNGDKSAVAMSEETKNLACVYQIMEPPKSSSILRNSLIMRRPIRRVRFTNNTMRLAKIRDQKPSLNKICPGELHQRNPNAPKLEDRSQEETEWQEHWARGAAWKLAKKILKLKERHKAAFFSPTEKWCLPSPSRIRLEGRELVVDSGASMHMISRKDLNSAELDTVKFSRITITVVTAKKCRRMKRQLSMSRNWTFLTLKILEDTPAVLSLGKLCEDHGYSYEWTSGQKPCLIKHGIRIQCNTEIYVPIFFPGLSTTSSSSSSSGTTPPTSSLQEGTGSTQIPAPIECESADDKERGNPSRNPIKNQKQIKKEDHEKELGNPSSSEIPEWLQEFLVDERVKRRDSHASSCRETSLEPQRRMVPGNHSIYTHFPKHRNCEICRRTKIIRSPWRKRTGEVLPCAEFFCDF